MSADALPGGTHFIAENIRYGPLSDEHKARVVEYLDRVGEDQLSKRVRGKSAFIVPFNEIAALKAAGDAAARADYALQLHRFALEYFALSSVPVAAFAFDDKGVVSHSHDPLDLRDDNDVAISVEAWEKHSTYLDFLYPALAKAPLLRLAITRLCRAFRQGPTSDGVIDLAIGLECLVAAQNEIKFQFSLYHALINADELVARQEVFELLQQLYDVRSLTVHGGDGGASGKRKSAAVAGAWDRLIKIARDNFTYYVVFCERSGASQWQSHLRGLALGGPRVGREA